MNLKVTGLHLEVTPALREYVETKMERVTRHVDHVIDISVTLSVDKLVQKLKSTCICPARTSTWKPPSPICTPPSIC